MNSEYDPWVVDRNKVRQLMAERGHHSQWKMAVALGMDQGNINRFFHSPDPAKIAIGTVGRIADALGVPITDLLCRLSRDTPVVFPARGRPNKKKPSRRV